MCTKLNIANSNSNVMLYLKLREGGCDKVQARQFCRKNFCKIDQSQKSIGPPGHKVLKLHPNHLQGEKGWEPGFMMKYDLGSGYRDSKDLVEEQTPAEEAILKQYEKYEKKKSAALLQKMLAVKNYADSLKPPKIDVFNKDSIDRIRKISQELNQNQQKPKKYYQQGDMKYYALAEYISTHRSGSLNDLRINFDPIVNTQIKLQTENSQYLSPTKHFKRQSTISAIEKGANLIMAFQNQTPINEELDTKSSYQNNEVASQLLRFNHHKLELAEEFNSTQYLFTPSSAHTRQVSQIDQNDEAVKCFVQQFYDKQYNDKVIPSTKRNLRLRTIGNNEIQKQEPSKQIKKKVEKRLSM
ncbi:unnamed protein product [Paramecium pentaurelia]|uniref:Uncharacterized protein n=1 Tax=Paramecium pentaurelia TaxID=43138 RepID=A0A8S1TSR8_9CILI|nr:unnamed protein product [Paramecium pentaurelia]